MRLEDTKIVGNGRALRRQAKTTAANDRRWNAQRYLREAGINGDTWDNYDNPRFFYEFARDKWKRDDDHYDRNLVVHDPRREAERTLALGGHTQLTQRNPFYRDL